MNNSPNPRTEPVRAAIDSTVMLVAARFGMPTVIMVLGWLFASMLNDMKDTNKQVWIQLSKMNDAQAVTNVAQSGLSVKVDGAVKQLDHLQTQVDGLPKH